MNMIKILGIEQEYIPILYLPLLPMFCKTIKKRVIIEIIKYKYAGVHNCEILFTNIIY